MTGLLSSPGRNPVGCSPQNEAPTPRLPRERSEEGPVPTRPDGVPATLNGPGQPKTWRCVCGDRLYEHSPNREPLTRNYIYGRCLVEGCACESFVSEHDAALEAARREEKGT